LVWVLDVTRFAVDTILGVDHIFFRTRLFHPFIDSGGTIASRRPCKDIVLGSLLEAEITNLKVNRLVFFVIGIGKEDR
jgi:hypothetical protein